MSASIPIRRFLLRPAIFGLLCMLASTPSVAEGLSDRPDPALQVRLEEAIESLGLKSATADGGLALALADVTDPDAPKLAMINGHQMIYAASLPKIAILLGAAVALEEGSLVMEPALERDLHEMIRVSCNACATRVLDQVGRERLIEILQSPEYRFYDPQAGGGLWVGKPYGPESAYARDPLARLSHGATVFQVVRFYYRLQRRELVSPEQSEMMLATLADPGLPHKFVKGLEGIPDLKMYRKSGSWDRYHADSALVVEKDRAYIMVALARDSNGGDWLAELAPRLRGLIVTQGGH